MVRHLAPYALLLVVAAGFVGFAWLTHHPDTPWVERAEGWPVVGRLAARFRAGYLGAPSAAAEPEVASAPEIDLEEPARGIERIIDYELIEARPFVAVPAGSAIREAPDPAAPAVVELEVSANFPMLERRGDWFQVRVGRERGWVLLEGYQEPAEPPLGREPEPPGPLPALAPDRERLAVGRALMAGRGTHLLLGPYDTYTDRPGDGLVEHCDRLAAQLEEVYQRRYGVEPLGAPAEAVLLFDSESDYRTFQSQEPRLTDLPASGYAAGGIVALFVGKASVEQVGATLIHELAHLLNRRAIGPALPPWLDEGIADDLAQSGFDEAGRLLPGTLGGEAVRSAEAIELRGALASAALLRERLEAGDLPAVSEVVGLDWDGFVGSERRPLHYAVSSFWIRFLLSGEDPELARGFRSFLAAARGGGPATGEALRAELGRAWPELDRDFRTWLRSVTVQTLPTTIPNPSGSPR